MKPKLETAVAVLQHTQHETPAHRTSSLSKNMWDMSESATSLDTCSCYDALKSVNPRMPAASFTTFFPCEGLLTASIITLARIGGLHALHFAQGLLEVTNMPLKPVKVLG